MSSVDVYNILQNKQVVLSPQFQNLEKVPARKTPTSTTLRPEIAAPSLVPKANGFKFQGFKSTIRPPSNLSVHSTRALSGSNELNGVVLTSAEPLMPNTSKTKHPDLLVEEIGGDIRAAQPSEDKKVRT